MCYLRNFTYFHVLYSTFLFPQLFIDLHTLHRTPCRIIFYSRKSLIAAYPYVIGFSFCQSTNSSWYVFISGNCHCFYTAELTGCWILYLISSGFAVLCPFHCQLLRSCVFQTGNGRTGQAYDCFSTFTAAYSAAGIGFCCVNVPCNKILFSITISITFKTIFSQSFHHFKFFTI